jgi:hypothetical protein
MNDTDPGIEAIQIALLRKASVSRRAAVACSLSQTVLDLSRRAIARANPGIDELELKCIFAQIHHGPEVTERLRAYLARKAL